MKKLCGVSKIFKIWVQTSKFSFSCLSPSNSVYNIKSTHDSTSFQVSICCEKHETI